MTRLINTLTRTLAGFLVAGVAFGCSTTQTSDPSVSPTHRWIAEMDVSRTKYNFDNRRCADEASVEVGATRKSAPAFTAYERCMEGRGYKLATYAPSRYPGRHP